MRETPEGFRLRFFDRIGFYRALQLDGKRIDGYHVVVKPLLGDPLGFEPIVHPTKPQFPYMQESRIQRMVRTCSWKGKMQLSNDFMFFLWFTFFMWCVMSIGRVQKWCHKAYR
ncbi:uncharacterized protein DMAD_03467 [Drosophila madeirensis]|uniref:Transmembrane protein n=1 Tax=Drosophila madeirensis TaxID=30013 RepID=A0AAU9GAF7_DROMD